MKIFVPVPKSSLMLEMDPIHWLADFCGDYEAKAMKLRGPEFAEWLAPYAKILVDSHKRQKGSK